jgi:hypothetical protein
LKATVDLDEQNVSAVSVSLAKGKAFIRTHWRHQIQTKKKKN